MAGSEHPYSALGRELVGTAFAKIEYVDATTSTNADISARLGEPRDLGLTLVAEYQSEGVGRKGRRWVAQPQTSLLFSTILPYALATSQLWIVPYGVALVVGRALHHAGVRTLLQWPNDLLIDNRKVAGILCTSRIVGDRAWVAAGIGINVHRSAHAADGIEPPPAFCDDVATVTRVDLLRDILLRFDTWHETLTMPPRIARLWERAAGIPGQRYRLLKEGAREPFDATAIALATGGGLIVEGRDGTRETVALGDARALR